ncbi:MAG: hypothetical protein ACOY4T_02310 [Pseudomonadota bacterium]
MAGRDGEVRRRQVFYLPGYDPFPARRYRELYRTEAALQSQVSGHSIRVSPSGKDPTGWRVAAEIEGRPVETEFAVLVWSDIVKESMGQGIRATYLQLFRTASVYVLTGAIFRVARLRKGPAIAALYPVAVLLLELAAAVLVGIAAASAIGRAVPTGASAAADWTLSAAAFALATAAVLAGFRRLDRHVYAYYLMHDYAHTARHAGAYPPDLSRRLSAFGDRVAAALAGDADEVMVVGHSSGAHLAVSLLADLVRSGRVPAGGPGLALLTLGHVVPMVSFLPAAVRLRSDLALLSAQDGIAWVDVTAPGDGCAFALCDPVAVSGVAPAGKRWPLVISAAFSRTLSPERWRALRWRFLRLHFQYLCAFDRPGDYDYFAITAGPQTLARRYAGRPPSPSRIEMPRSGYTSTAGAA